MAKREADFRHEAGELLDAARNAYNAGETIVFATAELKHLENKQRWPADKAFDMISRTPPHRTGHFRRMQPRLKGESHPLGR